MQLFGCPSTLSAPTAAFYGSKLSLLLAGRCMLSGGAVGCSRACDVWGEIDCVGLRLLSWWRGQAEWGGAARLDPCTPGAAVAHAGLIRGFVGINLDIV